jgi:hypothetical protein
MNSHKKNHFALISRRNFIMAAITCPLLLNKMLFNYKNEEIKPLTSNKDEDFVILAGWVLLKDDLIENLG